MICRSSNAGPPAAVGPQRRELAHLIVMALRRALQIGPQHRALAAEIEHPLTRLDQFGVLPLRPLAQLGKLAAQGHRLGEQHRDPLTTEQPDDPTSNGGGQRTEGNEQNIQAESPGWGEYTGVPVSFQRPKSAISCTVDDATDRDCVPCLIDFVDDDVRKAGDDQLARTGDKTALSNIGVCRNIISNRHLDALGHGNRILNAIASNPVEDFVEVSVGVTVNYEPQR